MKKALSLLITAAMLIAMLAGMAPAAFAAEAVSVGTADELIDVVTKINSGELAADTDITLTADIDLTGKTWKPLKVYSGTFDGNGKTITGATINVTVANNNEQKLDGGADNSCYVIATYPDGKDGSYGEVGFALLAVKAENATFKNFTLKDSSMTTVVNFNKNWQAYYGGVVAYMVGGSISNVKMVNVDVPVHATAGVNMPLLCFGGIMVGAATGNVTVENCTIDADSSIDATANVKFDVAAFVGRHSVNGVLNVTNCSNAGTVKAAANAEDYSGLMAGGNNNTGCWAAVAVGRINADSEGVVILDVTNTGTITGARVNGATKIMVGDNQAGDTKVRFKYTAPGGLVGSVVEPQYKVWVTEGEKFYAPNDGIFLADKQLDEGKIELVLHRDAIRNACQCSGIIFCVTDADNDCNFWSQADVINYCLFVNEGGSLIFAIDGQYNEEGVYTGQKGWHVFDGSYNLPDNGHDLVAGVKLGVEFDNDGNVQCYVDGKLVYDVDVPENMRLPGTGFGFRMVTDADDGTYTSSITATEKCYHETTKVVGAKEATETEPGYTGDKVCEGCGETVEEGSVISATGNEGGNEGGNETPDPVDPPQTGDMVLTVSVLALAAAAGAVVIARKRKIEE